MVLAKIYSISPSHFASLCGDDFLDYDAVLPYQENQFTKDNSLTVLLNSDATKFPSKANNFGSIELKVRSRYFTSEEIEKLEARSNTENSTDGAATDVNHLHLMLSEDELGKHGLFPGQIVSVDFMPARLSRITLTATYDNNVIQDPSFLVNDSQHLKFDDEECYVGEKRIKDVCYKGTNVQVELQVIHCEPVSQGVTHSKTQWVILDASCNLHRSGKSLYNDCNDDTITAAVCNFFDHKLHHSKQSLLLAGFAAPLKELWYDEPQDKTVQLKIESNYWNMLHWSFINSLKNKWEHDENDTHCLYVSMETLIELGVQNGCWVKVWLQEESICHTYTDDMINQQESDNPLTAETCSVQPTGEESASQKCNVKLSDKLDVDNSICHYAQMFAIHPSSQTLGIYIPEDQQVQVFSVDDYINKTRKTVHVSPLLLFNISHGNSIISQYNGMFLNLIPETKLAIKPSPSGASSMPFAKDAHLSLINTPYSKPGDTFDDSLKRYFSKPRLLTVGDVLCVDFDVTKDGVDSVVPEEWYGLHTIYFKVKRLVAGGKDEEACLVDMWNTTVYQSMSVHSFVPIGLNFAKGDYHKDNHYWMSTLPPGLQKPTRELISIIKPYLKQCVNLMPAVLMNGQVGVGKGTVVSAVARTLGVCVMNINCYDLIGESVAATESRINNVFQKATSCRPCILLLRNINTLVKDREGLDDEPRIANTLQQCITTLKDLTAWPVVVIATTSSTTPLSAQLYSCFLHEIQINTPTKDERKEILESLAAIESLAPDVSFDLVAQRTAGLVLADLVALFTKATNVAYERASAGIGNMQNEEQSIGCSKKDGNTVYSKERDDQTIGRNICRNPDQRFHLEMNQSENIYDERFHSKKNRPDQRFHSEMNQTRNTHGQTFHLTINQEDFDSAIEILRAEHSDAIGAPKIPNVSWQDIGGLLDVKAELLDTIQLPLQHPELFASGLRRSGVLLYGPPGTGKTLLAKAVATECSLNFLSVKGPELINMYVGQSEENVRQVFSRAQSATPCVIFFDELDSLAPNRGRSGDSGGVMDRVVSQLLAELDGLHKSRDVFVIGATNRPDLLDPALLRPGRFDKLLYLGISEDHEAQLKILKALTNKFDLDDGCDLEAISQQCPLNLTGADLYALCSDAMLHAIKRAIAAQPDLDHKVPASVKVNEDDFLVALDNLTPSVPTHELQRYKTIQQQLRT